MQKFLRQGEIALAPRRAGVVEEDRLSVRRRLGEADVARSAEQTSELQSPLPLDDALPIWNQRSEPAAERLPLLHSFVHFTLECDHYAAACRERCRNSCARAR